mmetsp:Transcript_36489/g.113751  ORF Transcript_36489/g.113751 Transcript_36489/m.113751 type:complete len:252 (-) Transcript_36489:1040-1795(-)
MRPQGHAAVLQSGQQVPQHPDRDGGQARRAARGDQVAGGRLRGDQAYSGGRDPDVHDQARRRTHKARRGDLRRELRRRGGLDEVHGAHRAEGVDVPEPQLLQLEVPRPGERAVRPQEDPCGAVQVAGGQERVLPGLHGRRLGVPGLLRQLRRRHPRAAAPRHPAGRWRRQQVPTPEADAELPGAALPRGLPALGMEWLECLLRRVRRRCHGARAADHGSPQVRRQPLRRPGGDRLLQHAVLRQGLRAGCMV